MGSAKTKISAALSFALCSCELPGTQVPEANLTRVETGVEFVTYTDTTTGTRTTTSVTTGTGTGTSVTVCDPFGQEPVIQSRTNGLRAQLFALPDTRYNNAPTNVASYIDPLFALNANLYFSQVNVPTRPFDRGFVTQTGETITRPNGGTLYEYFALSFWSQLALAQGDLSGEYQFAILSDDGAIVSLDRARNGNYTTLLNNDGVTPTRMRCSSDLLEMDENSLVPMKLDYFQGPRFHISVVLLWRRYDAAEWAANGWTMQDPLCNQAGNDLFFSSSAQPPTPQAAYQQLESRGWKVVQPGNFVLEEGSNPCTCQGINCGPGIGV